MPPKPKPLADRFWAKVDVGKPDECWNWTGAKHPFGYGKIWTGEGFKPSYHVSFLLVGNTIPAGMLLRHKCDNPSCVNPAHLEVGTTKDNIQDKLDRKRGNNGIKHGNSKLSDADVLAIRSSSEKGIRLAELYGVSRSVISMIKSGKAWKHLMPEE